jgi:hypothetical protein
MKTVLIFVMLLFSTTALAHKPSDSYLTMRVDGQRIDGQWDIALRDMDNAIRLDDGDGQLTWDEVRSRHAEIAAYALSRLTLKTDGQACVPVPANQLVDNHSDGAYTVLRFVAECPGAIANLSVDYRLFADLDPQHRGLVRVEGGQRGVNAILGGDQPGKDLNLASSNWPGTMLDYVKHGVWHIWIGFDHILFLVSLLLPAVLARQVLSDVLKVVTAFTIAHSITLSLAALGIVALPSRWVEAAIAASVALAALNNLVPIVQGKRWIAAFVFGLLHGFGFASVLGDLGLPQDALAVSLLGFNIGVELGQLAIIAVFLPVAWLVRSSWFYRRLVLGGGSAAILLLSLAWFTERAFDLKLTG